MGRGLVVTELMGQGVNPVTGDYSRGAVGFWVEGGEIRYPVEEVTIAGNLPEMYRGIVGDRPRRARAGLPFDRLHPRRSHDGRRQLSRAPGASRAVRF